MARQSTAAEVTGTEGEAVQGDGRKRRVNRGARGPQPVYLFVRSNPESGKLEVVKSFRDARKMATFMQSADAGSTQFLVTTPE